MPTIYTNCYECHYSNTIESFKEKYLNFKLLCIYHNENIEKKNILVFGCNIPDEIATILIKKSNNLELTKCSHCNNLLCKNHIKKARQNSIYHRNDFNSYMCSDCCWMEF